MNNSKVQALPAIEPTMTTIWLRRWVDMGPHEPADGEQISFSVPLFDITDAAEKVKAIAAIVHPGWTFDGWHFDYELLSAVADPF